MSSVNYCNTYYVKSTLLKNVLFQVQTIEKRIMSSAKLLKYVLSHVQTVEKRTMSLTNY